MTKRCYYQIWVGLIFILPFFKCSQSNHEAKWVFCIFCFVFSRIAKITFKSKGNNEPSLYSRRQVLANVQSAAYVTKLRRPRRTLMGTYPSWSYWSGAAAPRLVSHASKIDANYSPEGSESWGFEIGEKKSFLLATSWFRNQKYILQTTNASQIFLNHPIVSSNTAGVNWPGWPWCSYAFKKFYWKPRINNTRNILVGTANYCRAILLTRLCCA